MNFIQFKFDSLSEIPIQGQPTSFTKLELKQIQRPNFR